MFAAGSVEDLAKFYKAEGGIVVSGIWSVLVSTSPEQSADFARRYFGIFNSVVRGGWHLAVYAKHFSFNGEDRWASSPELHRHVESIRKELSNSGEKVPKLCAVFFDPNVGAFDSRSVIIPFNHLQLANEALYKAGFETTHQCIMRAFDALELDPYSRVPPNQVNDLLRELNHQLRIHRIKSLLTRPLAALGNAALGAVVGAI